MWLYSSSRDKSTNVIAGRAEVNFRCFHRFPAAIFVPLRGTPTWRFHTELCKFQLNVSANNSTTEYHIDLRLGEVV